MTKALQNIPCAVLLGFMLPLANAQDAPKKKGRMSIEQQMERYTTELNLTDEQKPKVKAVLEESAKKRQEIFSDTSIDRSQMREKMQPIMEEQNKKMKAILKEDQYKKYEEMAQRMGKKGGKKKADSPPPQ